MKNFLKKIGKKIVNSKFNKWCLDMDREHFNYPFKHNRDGAILIFLGIFLGMVFLGLCVGNDSLKSINENIDKMFKEHFIETYFIFLSALWCASFVNLISKQEEYDDSKYYCKKE